MRSNQSPGRVAVALRKYNVLSRLLGVVGENDKWIAVIIFPECFPKRTHLIIAKVLEVIIGPYNPMISRAMVS